MAIRKQSFTGSPGTSRPSSGRVLGQAHLILLDGTARHGAEVRVGVDGGRPLAADLHVRVASDAIRAVDSECRPCAIADVVGPMD